MLATFYKNIPTVEIYFQGPMKQLIAEGLFSLSKRPIKRLGPYCFFANGQAVIIRYITDSELAKIKALKPARCLYLIDDDFSSVAQDNSLPTDYKNRLMQFRRQRLPEILALADTIVAPNSLIFDAYPNKTHRLLNPSYNFLCKDFSHFENTSIIKILFSGTRSHINDLLLVADVMAEICRDNSKVHFTTFLGDHVPCSLKSLNNAHHHKAKSWSNFKKILHNERFHIALAPYRSTNFNHARSNNKILDHGAFGAAGLYSNRPPLLNIIENGKNGLLLNDDREEWKRAIETLVQDLKTAKLLAQSGAQLSAKLGDPERVRRFWINELFDT